MEVCEKKILVTGASGFIGSALSKQLLKLGATVYAVSRRDITTDDEIIWYKGDLSSLNFVTSLIKEIQPDYIYHLASHVCGSREYKNMIPTFNDNFVTAFNLLLTVHKYPVKRLILAGSFEEINSHKDLSIPSSPYAAAKFAALNYALLFHKLYKTPVCIASLYMVYGPGQKDLTKLIPYVTLSTLKKKTPKLTSGNRNVDWVYVDDVVLALIKMHNAPNIDGHSIDIGSGTSIQTKNIVKNLIKKINPNVNPNFGALNDRKMEQEKIADIKETYKKIKWKPTTSLETGLLNTINYYTNLA